MAKKKATFRSTSRRLALEPRLLFDGAAAIAGADALDNHNQQEGQKDNAAHATSPAGENHAGRNTPAATTSFDFVEEQGGLSPDNAATLVVIDSRIPDYASLLDQLPAHAVVRVVDAQESGLDAIHAALAQGQFQAVHILSHGTPGSFAIGIDTINNETLPRQADALAGWATQLTADADILLYGCDIARGEAGALLVTELARLTSADVAASTDATGSADKGGNWVLERQTGSIEAGVLGFVGYADLLADASFSDTQLPTAPREVAEDGSFTLQNFTVSGAGTLTVTITLTENNAAPAGGSFSLSTITGLTFATGDGTNDTTMSFSGSATDINTALASLTYAPTANFNGAAKLAVVSGGNSKDIGINVIPVNDAPNFAPPAEGNSAVAQVDEEGTGKTVTLTPAHFGIDSTNNATLGLFDPDLNPALSTVVNQRPEQIVFEVKNVPGKGRLVYGAGNSPLLAGSLFSLKDLIDGNVKYQHDDTKEVREDKWAGSSKDSFELTVRDGAGGEGTGTVHIKINPVNDAPGISGGVSGGVIAYEGRNGVPISVSVSDVDQLDPSGSWTFTFSDLNLSGAGTTLYLDNNGDGKYSAGTDTQISNGSTFTGTQADLNAKLKLDISDDEPTAPISFKIAVTDDGGGAGESAKLTTTATITIDPRENNDHPVLTTNTAPDLAHAHFPGLNVHTITGADLKTLLGVTDVDSPKDTLTYTLVTNVIAESGSSGTVYLLNKDGKYMGNGNSFTQAQLEAGDISIVFTGGGENTSHFNFQVRDGELTAFSTVKQQVWASPSAIEGGTRDSMDDNYLTHSFYVRFNVSGSGGSGSDPEPANQAPTVGKIVGIPASALKEGQSTLLYGGDDVQNNSDKPGIVITDNDNADSEITIRLEKVPTGGHIELKVSGSWQTVPLFGSFTYAQLKVGDVRYVHEGGEQFLSPNLGFAFSVSDGSEAVTPPIDGNSNNFLVEANPVNDTPSVSASGTGMVLEGGTLTFNTTGNPSISLSDVDGSGDAAPTGLDTWKSDTGVDELYVTVSFTTNTGTAANDLNGKLYYNGVEVANAATLKQSQVQSDKFTYVHDGSENHSGTFTLTVNDEQNKTNSDGHATSVGNTLAVNIQVAPLNDPPSIDPSTPDEPTVSGTMNTGMRLYEGGSAVIAGRNAGVSGAGLAFGGKTDDSTTSQLIAIDPDNSDTQIQYKILTNTAHGKLSLNGAVLGVGSTFTQADLNLGRVKYTHDATESAGENVIADKFTFQVGDSGPGTYPQGQFDIEILPANDKPTVDAPTGHIVIDSASIATSIDIKDAGGKPFTVDDADSIDNPPGTADFLQVTVRLLDASGNPITNYATGLAGAGVTFGYTAQAGGDWFVSKNGSNDILQFQGSKTQVNAALAGLTVSFANDQDAKYQLQVIVDDRTRNSSGALVTTGNDANGGELNEPTTPSGSAGAVSTTVFNWASNINAPTATTDDGYGNISAKTVELWASNVNDPPVITVPGVATALEDIRTQISGITYADPDAFGSTSNTLTLSVDTGALYFSTTGTSVPGGASVSAGAVGSASVTLTGTKAQLDAALASLYYLSPTDFNGNTASATDATLTVTVNDGGNTGLDSGGSNTDSKTVNIQITPVNDKPTVTVPGTPMAFRPGTVTPITGISVGDKDIRGDISTNGTNDLDVLDSERDFVQVTVRVVEKVGTDWTAPRILAGTEYNAAGTSVINIGFNGTPPTEGASFEIDDTFSGTQSALVIRGELDQVNAYLAGLTLEMTGSTLSNADERYGLEIIVDDRARNVSTGALVDSTANGGNNPSGNTTTAPPTDALTPYAAIPVGLTAHNAASAIRELLPSDVNDPALISGSLTVAEGNNNYVTLAALNITDPDALETDVLKATITLPTDFTLQTTGSVGGTFTGVVGGSTFTIEGTLAQINARLDSVRIALPNVAGDAVAADWNGSFDVTVVVDDLGNNGDRPGTLAAGDNATTGTHTYKDGADNDLITTRTITFTVTPTNDAPVAQEVGGKREASLDTINEDPGFASGDAAGSNKTVTDLFSPYFNDAKDEIKSNQVGTATTGTGSEADTFWGVAVVGNAANAATEGVWQYHNGTAWVDISTSLSNASALILDSTTPLRFNPVADYFGDPGKLSVRLIEDNANNDTSSTASVPASDTMGHNIGTPGGTSRYSSDVVTLGITVTNVNDRPTVNAGTTLTTTEDIGSGAGNTGTAVSDLSTLLGYSDATDKTAATDMGGMAITANATDPATGKWQYSIGGGAWTDVPTTGLSDTSALVLDKDDRLRFLPAADYNGAPTGSLTVRVADSVPVAGDKGEGKNLGDMSDATSTWSATTALSVTVNPVNDAPVLAGTTRTTADVLNENANGGGHTSGTGKITLLTGAGTSISDIDLSTTAALIDQPTRFGAGSLTVKVTNGYITGDVLGLADGFTLPTGVTIDGTTNGAGKDLLIRFDHDTTLAEVQSVLNALSFHNTTDNPAGGSADRTVQYEIVVNDGLNQQSATVGDNAGSGTALDSNVLQGAFTLAPANDPPVATPNTNSVTEDSGTPATGNVKTDGTADSDPDNVMSTVPVTSITATTAGGSATTVADNAGAGTVVTGKYGTLTIHPDGSYSYALDNTNPDVNALTDSGTLTEVFNYTIKDPGDLTASSTLTITINGHTDGTPQIVPVDGNAGATGQATVNESGLSGGSEAATSKETTTGSLTVTAPDGLKEVTIGGTTFTVAQLGALSVSSPSAVIDTGEGELRITGITINTGPNGAPKDASIGYTYTLKAAQTHTGATATESTDVVTLAVKDVNDVTGSGNLTIQIVDDVPTASNDTNSITKGAATVTGNAFTNDSIGADGAAVGGPVTAITGGTLGSALAGSYGSITLNADGSYSYALDNSNLAVTALQSGQTLTDTFTYTITDKDGDASTATVTITINGYTPPPPNQVPVAVDDIVTLDEDVPYTGTLAGNDTPSPDGGNVWSKTTDPQHGTVVVNPGGTFTYTPDPDYNGTDSFTYTITDANGDKSTATVTLTVRPVNDVPVATPDSTTTPKDKPVSGNLASNDMPSPDGGNVWSKTTDPSHGTVVVNPDGTYTYTPNEGFTGTDSFTYTVRDVDGDTSTATVTVTVTPPVVEPPVVEPPVVEPPVVEPPVVEPPVVEPPVVEPPVVEPPVVEPPVVEPPVVEPPVVEPPVVEPPVVEPPVPPVEPPAPPVEPPYIEPPTVPQSPYSPPPALVDSPQGLVTGDVAHMPGVFNDFGDQHRIVRMQIPLHPIIYVTREVADRQAEQAMLQTLGTDMGLHEPGQQRATSIGLGLGQDPTLYVQHAVRDAQREGSLWERLARKIKGNLSPLAPEPDLNPASDAGIPESLQGTQRPGQGNAPQAAPDMPEAPATEETAQAEHLLMQRWAQQEAAQDKPTRGVQPMAGSFQQQLQVQARKLPSRVS